HPPRPTLFPYTTLFRSSGDVKYHLGARGKHESPEGRDIALTLAANPSHLEAVDPVVEGMARAEGDAVNDSTRMSVLPVLVHGDRSEEHTSELQSRENLV